MSYIEQVFQSPAHRDCALNTEHGKFYQGWGKKRSTSKRASALLQVHLGIACVKQLRGKGKSPKAPQSLLQTLNIHESQADPGSSSMSYISMLCRLVLVRMPWARRSWQTGLRWFCEHLSRSSWYTYTYIHAYIDTYIHTYIHIYLYTHILEGIHR